MFKFKDGIWIILLYKWQIEWVIDREVCKAPFLWMPKTKLNGHAIALPSMPGSTHNTNGGCLCYLFC